MKISMEESISDEWYQISEVSKKKQQTNIEIGALRTTKKGNNRPNETIQMGEGDKCESSALKKVDYTEAHSGPLNIKGVVITSYSCNYSTLRVC